MDVETEAQREEDRTPCICIANPGQNGDWRPGLLLLSAGRTLHSRAACSGGNAGLDHLPLFCFHSLPALLLGAVCTFPQNPVTLSDGLRSFGHGEVDVYPFILFVSDCHKKFSRLGL